MGWTVSQKPMSLKDHSRSVIPLQTIAIATLMFKYIIKHVIKTENAWL